MIDFSALLNAVHEAVALGLGEGAEIVAERARAKAPVRRIFSGRGPAIGLKTADEIEADKSIRASLGLSVEGSRRNPTPRIVRGRVPPRRWQDRRLSQADRLLAARESGVATRPSLSSRGAYEVRTRRAVGRFNGNRTIGGTLRASIKAEPPTRRGGKHSTAWVIASADYAKYMEFGTRHAAAQPFLRPAAEESRGKVASIVGDWVGYSTTSRASAGKYEIEVVVSI